MPYISKEQKDAKAVELRALAKEYGIKATVARKHGTELVLNISGGKIDFIGHFNNIDTRYSTTYIQVNHYRIDEDFTGIAKEFLIKAFNIMNAGNYNNSDYYTDYFDIGFFISINIGQWNKPYKLALAA